MTLHAANLATSDRLQRVHDCLRSASEMGVELTTRDLIRYAGVCAVNSCIAELRANGVHVKTRQEGRLYYYSLGTGQGELAL